MLKGTMQRKTVEKKKKKRVKETQQASLFVVGDKVLLNDLLVPSLKNSGRVLRQPGLQTDPNLRVDAHVSAFTAARAVSRLCIIKHAQIRKQQAQRQKWVRLTGSVSLRLKHAKGPAALH